MRQKIWVYKEIDETAAAKLAESAGISPLLAKFFVSRGKTSAEYVRDFLNPDISHMHDPFLMDGMDRAAGRLIEAVNNHENILVFGDYDVDGVAGTSLLYNFLASRGARVQYCLPDRMEDGYGLTMSAVEKVKEYDVSLVITVDCGITSCDEIHCLQESGMQVIVTDHHECKEVIPDAYAVLNPHKPGCGYPFKDLAGAGVALKLVQAICKYSGCDDEFTRFLDLAALATIADMVPLEGENRIIARYGLKAMESTQNVGLSALIKVAGLAGKPVTSYGVAFALAPRVNAAGRLGSADRSVRLFTEDDRLLAEALARELDEENRRRQKTEDQIVEEAVGYVETDAEAADQKVLVICGDKWHHGVIGIVASKIVERYGKPCIVISVEDGVGKGSGRSIKGFNLFKALTACEDLTERYGGHEMAAGLTIREDRVDEFRRRINDYASGILTDADLIPCLRVDAFLGRSDITADNVRELSKLAPFGESNPIPCFGYLALSVADIRALSGGKHLKMRLSDADFSVEAIGFGMGESAGEYKAGDAVDVVFTPELNTWNNTELLQFRLRDIKPCIYDELDKIIVFTNSNDYNIYIDPQIVSRLVRGRGVHIDDLVPGRSDLEAVYRYLRACSKAAGGQLEFRDLFELSARISAGLRTRINFFKLKKSLEIFDELGLLSMRVAGNNTVSVKLEESAKKVELKDSRILAWLGGLRGGILPGEYYINNQEE
ncbi:MAG: single-stranded-DNA-specific exonuclease RecJ [Acetivibrionales bacterium]